MTLLQEYRKKYPQYDGIPDQRLADALYKKHYSKRMDRADYDKKIGLSAPTSREKLGLSKLPPSIKSALTPEPNAKSREELLGPKMGTLLDLSPGRRKEMNKGLEHLRKKNADKRAQSLPKPLRRAAAIATGASQGSTFGVNDHLTAALSTGAGYLTNSKQGKDYRNNLENFRDYRKALQRAEPVSYTVSDVVGSVAGGGKIGKAALKGRKAWGLAPKANRGIVRTTVGSGVTGATAAGVRGTAEGHENVAGETALGGLLGGASNIVFRGAGAAVNPIISSARGAFGSQLGATNRAKKKIFEAMRGEGLTPQDVVQKFKQAQDDGVSEVMLADILGKPGLSLAKGTARSSGPGAGIMRDALDKRQAGHAERMTNHLSEAFDAKNTAAQEVERLEDVLRTTDDINFAKVSNKDKADPGKAVEYMDQQLKYVDEGLASPTYAEKRLIRHRPVVGRDVQPVDRLTEVYRDIRNEIYGRRNSPEAPRDRKLIEVRDALRQELENISEEFRHATGVSAQHRAVIDAVGEGQEAAISQRPADVIDRFNQLSDNGKAAFRVGMADKFIGNVEKATQNRNSANALTSKGFDDRIEVVLERAKAEKLRRQLAHENSFAKNRQEIAGGSQTADNLEAIASVDALGPFGQLLQGRPVSAAMGLTRGIGNVLTGKDTAVRQRLAEYLTINSDDAFMRTIADKLDNNVPLNDRETQKLINAGILVQTPLIAAANL